MWNNKTDILWDGHHTMTILNHLQPYWLTVELIASLWMWYHSDHLLNAVQRFTKAGVFWSVWLCFLRMKTLQSRTRLPKPTPPSDQPDVNFISYELAHASKNCIDLHILFLFLCTWIARCCRCLTTTRMVSYTETRQTDPGQELASLAEPGRCILLTT